MTNTILVAGPHDPDEIMKSVKRGVFAKRFGGGQVNISNGDFVFSLTESYLIEDGKITAPLKGVNLIGNGPDVLRKVTMLGQRRRGVGRHLDVRQGRPERAGRRRDADDQDRRHHRRAEPRSDDRACAAHARSIRTNGGWGGRRSRARRLGRANIVARRAA